MNAVLDTAPPSVPKLPVVEPAILKVEELMPESIGVSEAVYGESWQQPPLQEQEEQEAESSSNRDLVL
jgi:hypothetical protein